MPRPIASNPIDKLICIPGPRGWTVITLLGTALLALSAYWLYDALVPLMLALLLAYACSPMVDYLEKHGWRRGPAVGMLLAGLSLALGLATVLLIPLLVEDAKDLGRHFPEYARAATDRLLAAGQSIGLDLPERETLLQSLQDRLQAWTAGLFSSESAFASRFVAGAANLLSSALTVLLVPVFFFFFLRDLPQFRLWIRDWVPARYRPHARNLAQKVDRAFSGYIRGQITVALILAAAFAISLCLLGVKYGIVIGILAGLLNIVPYVGQAIGLLLAMMMAIVDFNGWGRLIAIPILFGTMNFIEGTFITPHVVGEKVGLTPLQAMLALLLGGAAAGFFGLMLAIPVFGAAKALLEDLGQVYFASQLYRGLKDKKGR